MYLFYPNVFFSLLHPLLGICIHALCYTRLYFPLYVYGIIAYGQAMASTKRGIEYRLYILFGNRIGIRVYM